MKERRMTEVEQLATFVVSTSYNQLSDNARQQVKIRILDALGCAIGAVGSKLMERIRTQIDEFGGAALCSLLGGGRTAPDRAAFYNAALVRYLDFNDSYLAPGESCHPSDNLGPVLAGAQYADQTGKELMVALAAAYQVQCRLSDVAPVRAAGFDHTTQGAYGATAGVCRALGLDQTHTSNALAISGAANVALRVARTGALSNWKGLASPNMTFDATHLAFLAMRGITGPLEVFEGNKGFKESIAGEFEIDWSREDLERITRTIVKKYNAEMHAQATIEGILELQASEGFEAEDVDRIEIETFEVAFHIIGGGEEGNKYLVSTKEQADHSLQYIVAVAILDRQVMPEQYLPGRIQRPDVQTLLRRVVVKPSEELSRRFPAEMPCRIRVLLKDGRTLTIEKSDYEGFFTRPMSWESVVEKFHRLSALYAEETLRADLIAAVKELESIKVA
ncbi:MAG TPA: MmgE/PrpD family protein, partial [Chloroflexota bacterium]